MKQNVKLLEEINELTRQLHRLDLETRTELKKKRELKRMKDTGNTSIEDEPESVHPIQATAEDMIKVQNDIHERENDIARL
jgi:hypothetical protein